jgi:predicted unusual protein kinase regulating ubiquinone biosynthesis (AarF/ABC1/UbiB family)
MPLWQMNEVMTKDFGTNWRDQFQEFQDRPFAAARLNLFFSSLK